MKSSFFFNTIGIYVVVLFIHATCVMASTNEPSLASGISRLALADKEGATSYFSDRNSDISKCLRGTNCSFVGVGGNKAEAKDSPLSALPRPNVTDNMKDIILATVNKGFPFQKMGILPVWTGEAWENGLLLVLNGFPVPEDVKTRLLLINFQERSFGTYFWPESERTKKSQFSGFHPTDRFLLSRISLENMGYQLKFDKTFYIWRITGTNAPAASPIQ